MKQRKIVATENQHQLFLDTAESIVYVYGSNEHGQLGLGWKNKEKIKTPTSLTTLSSIQAVYATVGNSMFLNTDGEVFACGSNVHGILGVGDKLERLVPEKINGIPYIQTIAMSESQTIFLDFDGDIWRCGKHGSKHILVPEKLLLLPKMKAIAAYEDYTLFLDTEGLSVACGEAHTVFLDYNGGAWACGSNVYAQLCLGDTVIRYTPEIIPNLPPIQSIASARSNTLLQDINGSVWLSSFRLKKPRLIKNLPPICSKNIAVKAARKV